MSGERDNARWPFETMYVASSDVSMKLFAISISQPVIAVDRKSNGHSICENDSVTDSKGCGWCDIYNSIMIMNNHLTTLIKAKCRWFNIHFRMRNATFTFIGINHSINAHIMYNVIVGNDGFNIHQFNTWAYIYTLKYLHLHHTHTYICITKIRNIMKILLEYLLSHQHFPQKK